MTSPILSTTTEQPPIDLSQLKEWADPLPEKMENYPNYWTLKGWHCFVPR